MKKILATAALMIAVTTSAFAGTYGEVSYGTATATTGGVSLNHGVVRGIVGTTITPNIAVEGHAVVGTASATSLAKLDSSLGAFVKASYNITPTVGVFGRAGYVRNNWSSPFVGISGHDSGGAYGVGATYAVSKNSAVVLDYTQLYNQGGVRGSTITAGYKLNF